MVEEKDGKADSSPVTDVNADSSSVAAGSDKPELVESTTPKGVQGDVPFHQRPEFIEFKERQEAKLKQDYDARMAQVNDRADRLERELLERTRPQKDEADPYAHLDEETRKWYKQDEERVRRIADKVAGEREQKLRVEFDSEKKALFNEYGKMAAKEFLKENPEIKPGSEELQQIVNYARTKGLDLDEARKIVMFDKLKDAVRQKDDEKKRTEIKAKQAANVETKTINKEPIPEKKSGGSDITMDEFDTIANQLGIKF
jgi:hypothetical protein